MTTIFLTIIGAAVGTTLLILVRSDKLQTEQAIAWAVVGVAFIFLGVAAPFVDSLAAAVGITYGPALAMSITIIALIIKALLVDIDKAKLKLSQVTLSQELSILKFKVEKLERSARQKKNYAAPHPDENK